MELQLSLSLPTDIHPTVDSFPLKNPKRFFVEAFSEKIVSSKKLCFQVRTAMVSEEDDDPEEIWKRSSSSFRKDDEEKDKVVGWPPIKAWRKKQFHPDQHQAPPMEIGRIRIAQNENQKHVKVEIEGEEIERKINLSLYNSYQTLQSALITMFANYFHYDQEWKINGESFTLAYQDKEGNWLLARDLPWQNFIESVQIMKVLMKKMEHEV